MASQIDSIWHTEAVSHQIDKESYSVYSETGERKRKRHQKSRNGCLYCRQRRIKVRLAWSKSTPTSADRFCQCSEERPSCSNCARLRRACQYRDEVQPAPSSHSSTALPRPALDSPLLVSSIKAYIWDALASTDTLDPDLLAYPSLTRVHALESLDHFVQCDQPWLKTPRMQHVMQRQATDLVLNHPYLLHAVLAVSIAHLGTMQPECNSYHTMSLVHWQRSLRAYSKCLHEDLQTQNVDALYFTSHIHSMLGLLHAKSQPRGEKWELPGWITSMRGVHILPDMPQVVDRLRQGIWQPLLQSCELWHQHVRSHMAVGSQQSTSMALRALSSHCESISEHAACFYEGRINVLKILEKKRPSPQAVNALASFITKAPSEYIARLQSGDLVSLLLLFYWCRLFSRLGQWWVAQSASSECSRIYSYVFVSGDDKIRTLLTTVSSSQCIQS